MRYLIYTFMLFAVLGCGSKVETKQTNQQKEVPKEQSKTDLKSNQVIIEADVSPLGVFAKNSKIWKPSESDVSAAEKVLLFAFDDQKRGTVNRVLGKKPDDYNQQYIGAEYENGDKCVWINCFCKSQESDFKDWKTKLVFVKDGGNCFINVLVNLTKNTYEEFNVNGNG